jgi:solute carrier family 25, member 39/40
MLTYDQLLNKVIPHISPSPEITPLIAGITARTFVSSLASPLELLRTNLQSTPADPLKPHTLSSTLRDTSLLVKTNGIKALYRGLGPTLWRDVPFSGIYWAGYEAWKKFFSHRTDLPVPVIAFASGAISGMTSALLTHPFDVTKTRRQALVLSQNGVPVGTFPFMKTLLRTNGMGALFAGLTPRLVKIAPACGIMIASYEVRSSLSLSIQ